MPSPCLTLSPSVMPSYFLRQNLCNCRGNTQKATLLSACFSPQSLTGPLTSLPVIRVTQLLLMTFNPVM